jgi:hypothetical protein
MTADQTVTATFGVPKGTAITRALIKSKKRRATFAFSAPGAITGYQCKLKRRQPKRRKSGKKPPPAKFSSCPNPRKYKNLKPGRYTFKVRAFDILGADANSAVKKFTIRKPRHKRH